MHSTELLEAFDHLAACPSCRRLVGEAEDIQGRFTSLRDGLRSDALSNSAHLHYEQLAAYVDGASDEVESEIVRSHLEVCARCEIEAQDLQAFKNERASHLKNKGERAMRPAPWRFISQVWERPLYRIPFQLAGAAAALVLLVWIATIPMRNSVAELRARLDEAQRRNDELEKQTSTISDLQAQLNELQKTQTNTSSQMTQALYDGGRILALDNQGNVTGLESLPPQIENAIKVALNNNAAEMAADLRGLVGKSGKLMGSSAEGISFALLSPVGTMVKSDRPVFRWRPLTGSTSYAVDIFDSNLKNVARVDRLSETTWTPTRGLARNQAYTWQVTAIKNGEEISSPVPPAPEAKFKVLEQSKTEELNRAKQSYPNSHLILGSLYKKAGLLDDAETEFQSLISANPNSPLARKLLQNVKSLRQK